MAKNGDCKYFRDASHGSQSIGMCDVTNTICPYTYYCREKHRIENSAYYKLNGCALEDNTDNSENANNNN